MAQVTAKQNEIALLFMKPTVSSLAHTWYEQLSSAPRDEWSQISRDMVEKISHLGMKRHLPAIEHALSELDRQGAPVVEVTITSAYPMDEALEKKLIKELFGSKKVSISRYVDKSLLGGVVVQTADDRWDLSIRHQLRRLTRSIND